MSIEECRAIRRVLKQSHKIFNVGFTLRYSPHYRRACCTRILPPLSNGRTGIAAVTCFAIDEAMDADTVVNVHKYWDKIEMAEPSVADDA